MSKIHILSFIDDKKNTILSFIDDKKNIILSFIDDKKNIILSFMDDKGTDKSIVITIHSARFDVNTNIYLYLNGYALKVGRVPLYPVLPMIT